MIGRRAGKWRSPREEAAERPAGLVQRTGAAGGQRVRTPRAEFRPHAHANNRRRKCPTIFFSFSIRTQTDFSSSLRCSTLGGLSRVPPPFTDIFFYFCYSHVLFICLKKYANLLDVPYMSHRFLYF